MKTYTGIQSALSSNALRYAIQLSASAQSVPASIISQWSGLEYFWLLRDLAERFDERLDGLIERLERLRGLLLGLEGGHLVVGCDDRQYDVMRKERFYGLVDSPKRPFERWDGQIAKASVEPQGRIISSQVAFVALALPSVSYCDPMAAALSVASCIFERQTLHPRVREQGGAYGCHAASNASSGLFYFSSYRDPNIEKTMTAFDDAVEAVAQGRFSALDLEESKLEVIQAVDHPVTPGSRADVGYGWWREGKTLAVREGFRERVLSVQRDDIVQAVKLLSSKMEQGVAIAFSGKELLEKENALLVGSGRKPLSIMTI